MTGCRDTGKTGSKTWGVRWDGLIATMEPPRPETPAPTIPLSGQHVWLPQMPFPTQAPPTLQPTLDPRSPQHRREDTVQVTLYAVWPGPRPGVLEGQVGHAARAREVAHLAVQRHTALPQRVGHHEVLLGRGSHEGALWGEHVGGLAVDLTPHSPLLHQHEILLGHEALWWGHDPLV